MISLSQTVQYVAALAFCLTIAAASSGPCGDGSQMAVHPGLRKPTDITLFEGQYVTTELMGNRLGIFADREFADIRHFDPATVGQGLRNPHFLAVTPRNTLLISSGWGTSIVEIADLEGNGWKEFHGTGERFKAPHGVAADDEGWIYVGDSLNSRLVRFRDMDGHGWDVFQDKDELVAYNRQLLFKHGALWVSNSYENRPGLNKGEGGNVLRITDWDSGKAEVVYENHSTNLTGICPGKRGMYVALWGGFQRVEWLDLQTGESRPVPGTACELGVPYGMFEDPRSSNVVVTYFGSLEDEDDNGGLLFLPHPDAFMDIGTDAAGGP